VVVIGRAAGRGGQVDAGVDDAGFVAEGIGLEIDVEFDLIRVPEICDPKIIDTRA
jgi:hypothetical protein